MIFVILTIILAFICLYLSVLLIRIYVKYKRVQSDSGKILLAVKRVRYGDINVRMENLYNKELENVTNRLFEALYDRELMIKEYQATLSNKNLSLEEILKKEKQLRIFKEEFAATLTHDMKVPVIAELNSINYLLQRRFGNLNEKQVEILSLMKSSNQELKELIENMLDVYKLEENSLILNFTDNNLNEFLNNIIKEMTPIAASSCHQFEIDIEKSEGLNFKFDAFQLKRVIKNLIQNAISFSPNNSKILIKADNEDGNVILKITNKGSVISSEDLDLIFKKYYCGHSKFRKAGTGLGLYLSQQIALAHKGNIRVISSEDDNLTTFILKIPLNIAG